MNKAWKRRITDLHGRVHRGAYRAQPSRRVYIPKPDGRQRPLGIAALKDKIMQQAVVTVLQQIYEEDFVGFSYGFRPGRGAQDALDALSAGIVMKKVNWIPDADIQGFFDNIGHEKLMKLIELHMLATLDAYDEALLTKNERGFRARAEARLRAQAKALGYSLVTATAHAAHQPKPETA
jgi:hypothetical protein